MDSRAILAIFYVLIGCGLNNIFLEYIVRERPSCGHLITFSQFLFISIIGFFTTAKCGTAKPKIAMTKYITLVFFFFLTSVLNNWAFDFNIPVPLHMIFRSGSLIANMIMGIWILKKKYTLSKYLSVAMITAGIIICTFISSGSTTTTTTTVAECKDCSVVGQGGTDNTDTAAQKQAADADDIFWRLIGISILTAALFLSARMGIFQEQLYRESGKHPDEALFYTHLLSLPGFLLYYNSIGSNADAVMASESIELWWPLGSGIMITVPILLLYLVLNVVTQYLCISYVYVLTTECSSLTVTLVITLRKFLSLIFSIVYFNNPFTLGHWFGTILVFIGTLLFTEVLSGGGGGSSSRRTISESVQTTPKEKSN